MRTDVQTYLKNIEKQGDAAVASLLKRWDGVRLKPSRWKVPASQASEALKKLSKDMSSTLKESARRIYAFHSAEKKRLQTTWSVSFPGLSVGQKIVPVDSVGLYVPGGRFSYPSTVLMTAIPARVAGVRRVVMVTPSRHLTQEVLAAAALAKVDDIFRIGGVAAVGALAFGTRTVPRVDLIVGPGGAWVTEAKRQVFGRAGIDLLAGPSEIVLLADDSVPAEFVAADMMAQAEHDPLSRATMISTNARVLAAVRSRVDPRFRPQCRFTRVRGWAEAVERANGLAPEHLSLMGHRPESLLKRVQNAGAVFLGAWSPVAAGDYWAGPSHVLPTGRSARFSSGLSVQTFMKRSSVIRVSKPLLQRKAASLARLAEAEGLREHAASLRVRAQFLK